MLKRKINDCVVGGAPAVESSFSYLIETAFSNWTRLLLHAHPFIFCDSASIVIVSGRKFDLHVFCTDWSSSLSLCIAVALPLLP